LLHGIAHPRVLSSHNRWVLALFGSLIIGWTAHSSEVKPLNEREARFTRDVVLACNLSDVDLLAVTAAAAAAESPPVVLVDSPSARPYFKATLTALRAKRVFVVGSPSGEQDLAVVLGRPVIALPGKGPPLELWKELLSNPRRVVVTSSQPRRLVLQAACLAGTLHAPLYVLDSQPSSAASLSRQLAGWGSREVFAAGDAKKTVAGLANVHVVALANEERVGACRLRHLGRTGSIQALVVANPTDTERALGGMSALAPWLAIQKHAPLLLTDEAGDNIAAVVTRALTQPGLERADTLLLVAGLKAIPMERRVNPVPGKDAEIEMEPLTPAGTEPYSFAVGRLFQPDLGLLSLQIARQVLWAKGKAPLKATVVSNPGGSLPLLETFSRSTANELRNGGCELTSLFRREVTKEKVQQLLPDQDIFLWEGHHSTMTRDYGLPNWSEPLRPSLLFLQSCLALCEADALPLLQRGAIGVIGTSTRTYSASGGACSLAFFDALLYDQQSVGGSLRQAKNFLSLYAQLKEKRLGTSAKLQGANFRSAWAFSLWGDPTLCLPADVRHGSADPSRPLPAVRCEVHGNTIILTQPGERYDTVSSEMFESRMAPNARLAGLVRSAGDGDLRSADSAGSGDPRRAQRAQEPKRALIPLLFAEVPLPKAPAGKVPALHSRIPSNRWVFAWDSRRRCGYLLIEPRERDRADLRFHVDWMEN
jgi:Peptidase family C25